MYCPNCGKKIKDNDQYCNKCGNAIQQEVTIKQKKDKNVSLIIGIISIIGSIIVNILIIPLAVIGIIIGIKDNKKDGIILNIIASLLALIIFSLIVIFLFKSISYLEKKNIEDGFDKIYNEERRHKYKEKESLDITGTWFLYENNLMNQTVYYEFKHNKNYIFKNNDTTYVGTYTINNNINSNYIPGNDDESYELLLNIIAITKNDGSIVTDNSDKLSYKVYLEDNTLKIYDTNTNTYSTYKKNVVANY